MWRKATQVWILLEDVYMVAMHPILISISATSVRGLWYDTTLVVVREIAYCQKMVVPFCWHTIFPWVVSTSGFFSCSSLWITNHDQCQHVKNVKWGGIVGTYSSGTKTTWKSWRWLLETTLGGWVDECKSYFKDCLQQSKIQLEVIESPKTGIPLIQGDSEYRENPNTGLERVS